MFCKKKKTEKPNPFNSIIEKARFSGKRIILPEGFDERVLEAARKASLMDLCHIIIIGDDIALSEKFSKKELKNIEIINPITNAKKREMYANSYYELRKHKGMTPEKAMEDMKDNMKFACMMLYSDDADGVVAGAVYHSADVLKAAFQIIKTAEGANKVSSCFIMESPNENYGENGFLVFGDCAVIVHPNEEDIRDIAIWSAKTAESIAGIKPRVALLSYSTKGADTIEDESVQKMKNAYNMIRRTNPGLIVDGELQADAALVESVQRQKAPNSALEGKANVLIFPDLNAGNIGYKLVQRLAGVKAVGPIMQGLKKPVNDLSRGANADEIVLNMAITILQSNNTVKGV